jgi:hypothetical protein
MTYPRSPYDKEGGLVYFPRMLDKIRLQEKGELPDEYFPPMTLGFNANCCQFLKVEYEAVVQKVKDGLSDAEILQWCFEAGGPKSDFEIQLWNSFAIKKGWRDEDPGTLERLRGFKKSSKLEHREDILTVFDYIEVDEGRNK